MQRKGEEKVTEYVTTLNPIVLVHIHDNERCRRKKEASMVIQTEQSNTTHPRLLFFLMSCLGWWDLNPRHSTL